MAVVGFGFDRGRGEFRVVSRAVKTLVPSNLGHPPYPLAEVKPRSPERGKTSRLGFSRAKSRKLHITRLYSRSERRTVHSPRTVCRGSRSRTAAPAPAHPPLTGAAPSVPRRAPSATPRRCPQAGPDLIEPQIREPQEHVPPTGQRRRVEAQLQQRLLGG